MAAPIPLAEQIAELKREMDSRRHGYRRAIANGRMSQPEAEQRMDRPAAALRTLHGLFDAGQR